MKTRTLFLLFTVLFLISGRLVFAQITTDPALPVETKAVTITFDSSKEERLGSFTGELYAHTGVIIAGNSEWQHVIGDWANNTNQPKLTHKGGGIYELVITPDIRSFYSVGATERVVRMAFVFRSANWDSDKKQTNDLFVDVYEEGLVVAVTSPVEGAMVDVSASFTIAATSSQEATLRLLVGEQELAQTTGKMINHQHAIAASGWQWIIAEAATTEKTVRDSVRIFVKEPVTAAPKPAAYRRGINYTGDQSAALVLWAPYKESVFVLGDFNNWEVNNAYQMKKDGDWFWLDVTGLVKGQPYVFQYLIDGQIRIADPYTMQTSDPNDQYISTVTYPGLPEYPTGKAQGVASVLETGQTPYAWEVTTFTPPAKDRLVIYELLIRDFTTERSYQAVIGKLDYLQELGVNVLELMPVNEFEGNLSWGYNPSFYFAPDKYYGSRNDLKRLIDEAHKRGMAVVIDMVLNHSYGQSPLVQMYLDRSSWKPTAENPWYNTQHNFQNPDAQWGYDFNHESTHTRQLIDSINSFWMKEYKVDGFRFDFTKGFSNTVYGQSDWGSAYDAPRIANLKRMADEIWRRNPHALVIFEHLSDNSEEKELAAHGILLWGNQHYAYADAAKGNTSDLGWGFYKNRGWEHPHLVTYMESHDEERIVLECKNGGRTEGSYNIKLLPTALDRAELASLFMLPLPGPKMIWQFGELGYDYSINTCELPSEVRPDCRLDPKPVLWNYFDQTNRKDLYKMMGRLNYLKVNYDEFSSGSTYTGSLNGEVKWYRLSNGSDHVVAAGNFATANRSVSLDFPATGTWNDYFGNSTYEVTAAAQAITLGPGEFKLFTSRKMADPFAPNSVSLTGTKGGEMTVYPNPTTGKVTLVSSRMLGVVSVRNLSGALVFREELTGRNHAEIHLGHLAPGIYLLDSDNGSSPGKLVISR
ncbi:MAG TPA: alpha-amylase family glycosyl hydrolase [Prolixibacteraceae bacterium]|nr:alpha-amylase family glycosyl hydrolase [Prolixibacteraceae bacterium]